MGPPIAYATQLSAGAVSVDVSRWAQPSTRGRATSLRASVREACQTWRVRAEGGPVTTRVLEAIINCAALPILDLLQEQSPEAVVALTPSVVRTMLWAVLEVLAEQQEGQ